jgi:RNA polymerase-binding transcription factor DksA
MSYQNTTLTTLGLRYNLIPFEHLKQIKENLERNRRCGKDKDDRMVEHRHKVKDERSQKHRDYNKVEEERRRARDWEQRERETVLQMQESIIEE